MSEPPKKKGRPAKKTRAGRYEVSVVEQKNGSHLVSWPAPEKGQRRRRRIFATATAANRFADEKRADFTNRGRKVAGLRASAADDAGEAAAILAPYGVSILEAARDFVARAQARLASRLIPDAVDDFLESRKHDASARYFGDLRARLKRFAAAFPEHHASDFTAKDIAAWLADPKRSAIDRGNTRRVLSVFFGWCKLNHFARVNIVEEVPAPKEPDPKCDTFTPDELRLILDACPAELVPFITIQAFAGLRSAEVDRLDWKEVDFRRNLIRVDADKAKTGARRFVPIPPVLQAWLKPHAQLAGKVTPINVNAKLTKFRTALATGEDKAKRVEWRHNAMRHSFASYSLAKYEDAPKVALWGGHDVKTMLAHYRDLVAAEDAETWFSIMPSAGEELDRKEAV
jgi:integrase